MADDLEMFTDGCRRFRQPLAVRGSTAYMLCLNKGSRSVVGAVPPLGDLDLVVRDPQPAQAMQRVGEILEYYRAYVPASRFIHVDVFYQHLPARSDSPLGNVVIKGLPEVVIGGPTRGVWSDERSDLDQPLEAEVTLRVRVTLFRDFLFLLRLRQWHRGLDNAIGKVAALLCKENSGALGSATRAEGGARELARIDKALVKHVLLRNSEQERTQLTEYLPTEWLSGFANHLNGLSRRIILSEERWEQARAIVYAEQGRIVRFAEVSRLQLEEKELLKRKLAPEPEVVWEKLTPSLKVPLPSPPDPECCGYRDFSKGISELAFRDPEGSALVDVALMEGREKYYPVHAQAAEGFGVRSLRTDPGFMGILNQGSMNTVRLMGVRKR